MTVATAGNSADNALALSDLSALKPLLEALGNDQVQQIVSVCLQDTREKTSQIAAAKAQEDWHEVGALAHDVKSTAGQVGAARLCDIANRLEKDCKAQALEAAALAEEFSAIAAETLAFYDANSLGDLIESARQG